MHKLKLRESYKLSEIITEISEAIKMNNFKLLGYKEMDFCLYTVRGSDDYREDTICYLDDYPEVTDNDEEIYSDFVNSNSLKIFYFGSLFEDVIANALQQKSNSSISEFISCLNHYSERDNFLDLL